MALVAEDVRVAGNTRIYLAPTATAFPDWDDPLEDAVGWTDVGYVTTDGVTWNMGREIKEIEAMQSADPIRVISTKLPKTLKFDIMQMGRTQLALALGGGAWTPESGSTGVFRYEPPDVSEIVERAAVVEMLDGDNTYRWHIKRVQNREGVEFKYTRDDAATLPVTLAVLAASDGTKPFYLLTDDTAVAA